MSNIRWVTDNKALAASVMNGTGGAPAREETSPFTMEKALQHDRLIAWMSATTPTSPFNFDIDLGAAQSIEGVGVHGFEPFGNTVVNQCLVSSASTYPTFTLRATINVGASKPRDFGAVFAAQSFRYWRFQFTFTTLGQFKVGSLLTGPLVDLGIRQSGPYASDPFRHQVEGGRTLGGHPIIHDLGYRARSYKFPLDRVDDATKAKIEALADVTRTFALFDPEDVVSEVRLVGGRLTQSRPWSTLWDAVLDLEALG